MRVLVVDDSPTMRRIIANTLKKLGHNEILEAADGAEGLRHLASAPDLILTDWSMPNMDGPAFVKALRAKPEMAKVPVLVVATHAEKADVVLALRAGVNDYVTKPFTAEMLKDKIEGLVRKTAA